MGVAAAIWPEAWLGLFGHDPSMLATGAPICARRSGLRLLRPRPVALFRLAGRRQARLAAARRLVRLLVAVGGGWIALRLTGSLGGLFAALGAALVVYGITLFGAIASGGWFRR